MLGYIGCILGFDFTYYEPFRESLEGNHNVPFDGFGGI